jgi:hypothetical protein
MIVLHPYPFDVGHAIPHPSMTGCFEKKRHKM